MEKPLVLIFLGPPGAGKGTLATPVSEELGLPHISTGELFRHEIRSGTPLGKKADSFISQGKLVPDEIVLDILFERIQKEDCKQGFILDGFPRTTAQALALEKRLESAQVVAVNFEVPDSILVERITGRLACKKCNRVHHVKNDPPQKAGICDTCGGALYTRDDDREDILKKRLEVYRAQTAPLIDFYQIRTLISVDGRGKKEKVLTELLPKLPCSVFS